MPASCLLLPPLPWERRHPRPRNLIDGKKKYVLLTINDKRRLTGLDSSGQRNRFAGDGKAYVAREWLQVPNLDGKKYS